MTIPLDFLEQFSGKKIVVLGDVMLDRYLEGSVTRISPEAPVPVVLHRSTENRLGGAANVALNLKMLGAEPLLFCVAGHDADGLLLQQMLPQQGIAAEGLYLLSGRKTTVKTRVLAGNHQMLRIDAEDSSPLSDEIARQIFHSIESCIHQRPVDAIIFQDYNKGLLTAWLIESVIKLAGSRGIITTVDPKKFNFFAYKGVDLFKPNLKEVRESVPFEVPATAVALSRAAQFLHHQLGHRMTMVTLSEKGLFVEDGSGEGCIYPTQTRRVSDVSGAGDTVISIATLALCTGFSVEQIAILSNLAGGQVCEFPGVVPVQPELLRQSVVDFNRQALERGG